MRAEIEQRESCCWISDISDGSRTAGFLHLEQPEDGSMPENFVETTLLAEALARILGRLAQASTQLNQRNLDVATLLDLGLAVPAQDNLAFYFEPNS